MILHCLLWLLVPKWNELIANPTTGKASSKSLFGALGFFVAIGIVAWGQAAAIVHNRPIDNAAVLLLLLNGLGLAGAKIAQLYLNRKTADEQGQPLSVPPPSNTPPPIMPQVPNPNAPEVESNLRGLEPEAPDLTLAGYNDGPGGLASQRAPRPEFNLSTHLNHSGTK